jgi:hypothetical protein
MVGLCRRHQLNAITAQQMSMTADSQNGQAPPPAPFARNIPDGKFGALPHQIDGEEGQNAGRDEFADPHLALLPASVSVILVFRQSVDDYSPRDASSFLWFST